MNEIYECIIGIEQNGKVKVERVNAPRIIIEQTFVSLVHQAGSINEPCRIKLSRQEQVFDNTGCCRTVEVSIEYKNLLYRG